MPAAAAERGRGGELCRRRPRALGGLRGCRGWRGRRRGGGGGNDGGVVAASAAACCAGEHLLGEEDLGDGEDGDGVLVEDGPRDGGLHDARVDGDRAVGAGDVEGEAAGVAELGGQRGLDRVHDRLQRPQRVVGVEHVEAEHHGLAVGGERLQAVARGEAREGVVGRGEYRDPGAALVVLELGRHPRGLQHRRRHVEGARVGEYAGDVDGRGRAGLGRREVEPGGDDEAAHRQHAQVVRHRGDGAEDGGVRNGRRCWRADDGEGGARGGDVDGAQVRGGAARGLEQRGHELPGGGKAAEVGGGEVLEEDVVAEDVGEVGARRGRERRRRLREVAVRHGQQRQRRPPRELRQHGAGRQQAREVAEVRERRQHARDVDRDGRRRRRRCRRRGESRREEYEAGDGRDLSPHLAATTGVSEHSRLGATASEVVKH